MALALWIRRQAGRAAGRPVAHHVLRTLHAFGWGKKILICRSSAKWIAAYRDDGFEITYNDEPEDGMLGSLSKGVLSAQGFCKVLICLADMPLVERDHISSLLSVADRMEGRIIASAADDYRGPPAVFPVSELRRLHQKGEGGARSLLTDAFFVQLVAGGAFDIDTHQDLADVEVRL